VVGQTSGQGFTLVQVVTSPSQVSALATLTFQTQTTTTVGNI